MCFQFFSIINNGLKYFVKIFEISNYFIGYVSENKITRAKDPNSLKALNTIYLTFRKVFTNLYSYRYVCILISLPALTTVLAKKFLWKNLNELFSQPNIIIKQLFVKINNNVIFLLQIIFPSFFPSEFLTMSNQYIFSCIIIFF